MAEKAATRSATSNASLQLHFATPKKIGTRTQSKQQGCDARSSRYRLLDEREQAHEAQAVEQIKQDLALRRRRTPSAKSRTPSRKALATSSLAVSPQRRHRDGEDSPPPYDSLYEASHSLRTKPFADLASPKWTECVDEDAPESDDHGGSPVSGAVRPLASTDFQQQVLLELQKLKQAQQQDLHAIRQLQLEKEKAEQRAIELETTLRKHTKQQQHADKSRSRPTALTSNYFDDGDESAPPVQSPVSPSPPRYAAHAEHELDFTDGEDSVVSSPDGSHMWAVMSSVSSTSIAQSRPKLQICGSPVVTRSSRQQQLRPSSAKTRSTSHQHQQLSHEGYSADRPKSARSYVHLGDDSGDEDCENERRSSSIVSRGRSQTRQRSETRLSRGSSRARSGSREDLRRSCAFFDEKLMAQREEDERQRIARGKLERAARATPPANLLKRQEEAQLKKREQLQKIDKERNAELSPAKRVRARDVPPSTYVAAGFATDEEREQAKKERQLKRSQALMAQAELPTRMQMAKEQEQARSKAMAAAAVTATTSMSVSLAMSMATSVKARRKLQEQLEEEERRRQLMRAKPVPNFSHLQSQWEKALSVKKSKHKPTEPQTFFSTREKEQEDLRARKEARKLKAAEQQELARRLELERQRALLERTKRTAAVGIDGPKLTKADELRMKKVQQELREQRRAKEQETMEKERREMRLKEASRRVTAQVKQGETRRKSDYAGDFVELASVEGIAKERAKNQREQFRAAVQRNKERLQVAVATKPSLMERFAIDLQREEHKKNALEAVVKHVFQKSFKDMKGILTEEEEEVARDLMAADSEIDGEEAAGEGEMSRRDGEEDGGGDEDDEDE